MASLQDLWRYAVGDWLSLRITTANRQRTRWPVDPLWQEIQAIEVAPSSTGVVRRRLEQATLRRITQGVGGYVTSWPRCVIGRSWRMRCLSYRAQLERYMANKERSFRAEVSRKRARRLGVTAFLDDAKEEAARKRRRPECPTWTR